MSEDEEVTVVIPPPLEEGPLRRLFELHVEQYVDGLVGDAQRNDEVLLVRLRWLGQDIEKTIARLSEDPSAVVQLVHKLSTMMQGVDTAAGVAERSHQNVDEARRWSLIVLPEGPPVGAP